VSCVVEIQEIDQSSKLAFEIPLPQPLWNDPAILSQIAQVFAIRAMRGSRVVGFWLVPIVKTEDGLAARRPNRLFPYASPWLADRDVGRRRRVVMALVSALQKRVYLIDLPMSPGFHDANAAVAVGCFAEWRHTHVIDRQRWSQMGDVGFSATARAHARRAARRVSVLPQHSAMEFRFDKAIQGSGLALQHRKALGARLHSLGCATALLAMDGNQEVGGAFLVHDRETAYLYHTWFDRRATSGISSLLVREALRWTFDSAHLGRFDFEGSILAHVDSFMSNFGTEIQAYAHLYWAASQSVLVNVILESLYIQGRVADKQHAD
jgi:hypothetical protein